MANQTVIKLQDGNVMPQLGLGVWKAGNDEVVSAIHKALEVTSSLPAFHTPSPNWGITLPSCSLITVWFAIFPPSGAHRRRGTPAMGCALSLDDTA